jgi:hypothetical protein
MEFMALRERHVELVRAGRAIEQERDATGREAQRLSVKLAALERRKASGETIDTKKAEAALRSACVFALGRRCWGAGGDPAITAASSSPASRQTTARPGPRRA